MEFTHKLGLDIRVHVSPIIYVIVGLPGVVLAHARSLERTLAQTWASEKAWMPVTSDLASVFVLAPVDALAYVDAFVGVGVGVDVGVDAGV
eukprot:9207173-Pyramimonas_sp.AAC.1